MAALIMNSGCQVARQAMATRFEIALPAGDPVALRAAGEEALSEIERLEGLLSLYRPASEIARANARAAREPVQLSPPVFRLLEHAARLHAETQGAFDITIGPLMKCWGFIAGTGTRPDPDMLQEARSRVGMRLVELDPARHTVRFARDGVMLDLGAIGKGYAVGVAAQILREAGITSALIHGGTSTVFAIGQPPEADSWKVAIGGPPGKAGVQPAGVAMGAGPVQPDATGEDRLEACPAAQPSPPVLAVVSLRDQALSVSAVWGKSFQSEGTTFGHVIDPRTGQPANRAVLTAVVLPDATETDALSTALLTLGVEGLPVLRHLRPAIATLVARERDGSLELERAGAFRVPV